MCLYSVWTPHTPKYFCSTFNSPYCRFLISDFEYLPPNLLDLFTSSCPHIWKNPLWFPKVCVISSLKATQHYWSENVWSYCLATLSPATTLQLQISFGLCLHNVSVSLFVYCLPFFLQLASTWPTAPFVVKSPFNIDWEYLPWIKNIIVITLFCSITTKS